MKSLYKIGAFVLATLVGFLSSGFTVYQMNCRESCPTGLYLQDPHEMDDSCGMINVELKGDEDGKNCCSAPEKENEEDESDCCDVKELTVLKGFEFASAFTITFEQVDNNIDVFAVVNSEIQSFSITSGGSMIYRGPPDRAILFGKNLRIRLSSLQYGDGNLS